MDHRPDDIANVAHTIAAVNQYLYDAEQAGETAVMTTVSQRLGWTVQELSSFMDTYRCLLNYDSSLWQDGPPTVQAPPTELEVILSDVNNVPSEQEVVQAIESSEAKLTRGLRKMGLTESEADEWKACQEFNNNHFRESMDMISATVSRSQLMLARELTSIRDRLKFVREQIASYGEHHSQERNSWVTEERELTLQFVEVGNLMRGNQDTWFRGSAQLALIRMRYGKKDANQLNTRAGKPKFSPNITNITPPP